MGMPFQGATGECGRQKAGCHCVLPRGHDGTHACNCGGEWRESGATVTMPKYAVKENETVFRMLDASE